MKLSEDLSKWRSDRPDEWTMDRFIKTALDNEILIDRLKDLLRQIGYPKRGTEEEAMDIFDASKLMTHEQRGEAINRVRGLMGYNAKLTSPPGDELKRSEEL